jgi:hypothetical protein
VIARSRARHLLGILLRGALLVWLVGHFALTAAYVAPLNPVTLALQPLLQATIGTYFEQNWGMFAPNPRSGEAVLLARPLRQDEVAALLERGLPSDGWYDLSTPLWDAFHQNPFTAYDRLTRPQSRAMLAYLNGGPELALWREACQRGDTAACGYYEQRLAQARGQAATLLEKVGAAFLRDIGPVGPAVTHIALRARELRAVPWSERYSAARETQDIELGVYPVDPHVATARTFQRGQRE